MRHSSRSSQYAGFSLVELSIVLVILGLLVGGVLGGRSLIRAAELRKVVVEREQLATALNTFKLKYNALPGDFNKATQFWGTAPNCGSVDLSTGTCNGNGDGVLTQLESVAFWNQLGLAGLTEGKFSPSSPYGEPAENTFKPSASGFGHWLPVRTWLLPEDAAHQPMFFQSIAGGGNYMFLMNWDAMTSGADTGGVLPEDVWQVDTKIDDGLPATGILTMLVTASGTPAEECALTNTGTSPTRTSTNVTYNVSGTVKSCYSVFTF